MDIGLIMERSRNKIVRRRRLHERLKEALELCQTNDEFEVEGDDE